MLQHVRALLGQKMGEADVAGQALPRVDGHRPGRRQLRLDNHALIVAAVPHADCRRERPDDDHVMQRFYERIAAGLTEDELS